MCDFRQPPTHVKDVLTGELKEVKFHGHTGWDGPFDNGDGIYLHGATGCGYVYVEGGKQYNGYTYANNPVYEFVFEKDEQGNDLYQNWLGDYILYTPPKEQIMKSLGVNPTGR